MLISDWSSDVCSSDLIVLIGGVHELIAIFDDPRALGQGFENQEFRNRQRYIIAFPFDAMASRIHFQPASYDGFGRLRRFLAIRRAAVIRPAQAGPDTRDQQDRKSTRLNSSHKCAHR